MISLADIWVSGIVKMYSLAVAAADKSGAPRQCRLLWLMVPFLCTAL